MVYTKNTLTLPDGDHIFYTDSGIPGTDDYTTLVIQNGMSFNGRSFIKLHDYYQTKNVRLIIVNRRGYPGSSALTEEETNDLKAGQQRLLDVYARQNAQLLAHFVKDGSVTKKGGLVFAAWSLGSGSALSLFANPTAVPKDVYETIEPYLKSYVLYDPPCFAFGYLMPDFNGIYRPFRDPEYTSKGPQAAAEKFCHWVSSYFQHPDPTNDIYDTTKGTDRRTVKDWTVEEWTEGVTMGEVDAPLCYEPMQSKVQAQANKALLDESVAKVHFPNVKILHLSVPHTLPEAVWIFQEHKKRYDAAVGRGEKVRPHTFKVIEGTNHFVHYDYPEKFLDGVLESV